VGTGGTVTNPVAPRTRGESRRTTRLPPLALLYHGIAGVPLRRDPHGLFVRPKALRSHVATLRGWGYELLTFSDFGARVAAGDAEGCASLTFDDGPSDNLTELAPLLEELLVPATVFVPSAWLGRAYPYAPWTSILTADELRELASRGVEIGAHTVEHVDLGQADYDTALQQWRTSRAQLEDVIGQEVLVAAYPYGRASAAAVEAARDAGFAAAAQLAPHGSWNDVFQLPRQAMANDSTLVGLRLKRNDLYEQTFSHFAPRAVRKVKRVIQRALR
jgi:peptidoglycan/xylan/chitin deacetylase (PgdA/CDA1 family)